MCLSGHARPLILTHPLPGHHMQPLRVLSPSSTRKKMIWSPACLSMRHLAVRLQSNPLSQLRLLGANSIVTHLHSSWATSPCSVFLLIAHRGSFWPLVWSTREQQTLGWRERPRFAKLISAWGELLSENFHPSAPLPITSPPPRCPHLGNTTLLSPLPGSW